VYFVGEWQIDPDTPSQKLMQLSDGTLSDAQVRQALHDNIRSGGDVNVVLRGPDETLVL